MAFINSKNCKEIEDFAGSTDLVNSIQGSKLEALFRLIQKKGEVMQSNDKKLNGLKCLEIRAGLYVAIVRTSVGIHPGFYPCYTKTILLGNI